MESREHPLNDERNSRTQKDGANLFPDDAVLVRAALDGSESAYEAIVRKYSPVVRANLAGRVSSRHDQDDIFQEVFLTVFRNLRRLRKSGSMQSWIVKITRTRLNDHYRRQYKSKKVQAEVSRRAQDTDRESSDDRQKAYLNLYEENLAEIVLTSISKLKESQRTVVYLRLFESMSYAEIAERLNIREGTARARCSRGFENIRKLLSMKQL